VKKNDKLIVILGVVILILASLGIYYWSPVIGETKELETEKLIKMTGEIAYQPDALTLSDNNPFYALIATPLAINYDCNGTKNVIPMYVKGMQEVSDAIKKVEMQIDVETESWMDDSTTEKEFSLDFVKQYWESSKAVLLIKNDTMGYELGVAAVPIASYLSIPVIVTDEVDTDVRNILNDLSVEYSLVCGDLEGFGEYSKQYEDIDEIINDTIEIIQGRLKHDVEYITITNPLDASTPKVLDSESVLYKEGTIASGSLLPSGIIPGLTGGPKTFTFTIPEDYKYALVKLEVTNHEDPELIEKFGDNIMVEGSLTGYMRTVASPAVRDEQGNIEYDKLYFETVMYDMAEEEFFVRLTSSFTTLDSAKFEISVTVEKLENPYYPFMKQLSSVAPYLAAYREGIIFADTDFAFAPDDDVLYNEETLPGNTQVLYNPKLVPVINQHVYENIHLPLNDLIGKIRDINSSNIESLTKSCKLDPLYIAIVGDATMLPQYYYRSPHNDPFSKPAKGAYGTNCPSDYIYGNIDPEMYSLRPYNKDDLENDIYSEFPVLENIVGRIVGWDVQDASSLIARTVFYDDIIENLDEAWKKNALVMTGSGTEVQKLPILTWIQQKLGQKDPMKFPSGEKKFLVQRIKENLEKGNFVVTTAERGQAQRVGYSNEALIEIKKDGILNLLAFPLSTVKIRQGFDNINSFLDLDWWIDTIFEDGSGIHGGELQENSNLIICDQHAIWFEMEHGDVLMHSLGGPKILYELLARYIPIKGLRFATPLDQLGAYTVREVSVMDMGPSVMMIEGCGSGKIDGMPSTCSLANAYLHAGVNAYISPTTLSAFYGALEPRPKWPLLQDGVGFGIIGYIKAALEARRGIYPPVYFNQYIFEEASNKLFEDKDIGTALKEAKNMFLPAQFDDTFRWTPPLSIPSSVPQEIQDFYSDDYTETSSAGGLDHYPVEKYCTIYQINLLGDPAFNPYEPVNNG
jgi:hypothetical protein